MLMMLSVAILNVVGMVPNVQLLMYTAHSGPFAHAYYNASVTAPDA